MSVDAVGTLGALCVLCDLRGESFAGSPARRFSRPCRTNSRPEAARYAT